MICKPHLFVSCTDECFYLQKFQIFQERLPGFRRRVQRATEEPVTMQRSETSTQPESSNSNVKPTDNGENRENEGQQQQQQKVDLRFFLDKNLELNLRLWILNFFK